MEGPPGTNTVSQNTNEGESKSALYHLPFPCSYTGREMGGDAEGVEGHRKYRPLSTLMQVRAKVEERMIRLFRERG